MKTVMSFFRFFLPVPGYEQKEGAAVKQDPLNFSDLPPDPDRLPDGNSGTRGRDPRQYQPPGMGRGLDFRRK